MRNALTWRTAIGLAAGLGGVALLPSRTRSAATSVMIVIQYGIGYLPVMGWRTGSAFRRARQGSRSGYQHHPDPRERRDRDQRRT